MKIVKGYKFRIYPSTEQTILFAKHFGCVRYIYNRMLALKKYYFKRTGKTLNWTIIKRRISKLKSRHEWLTEANAQSLQESTLNLESGYQRFFKGLSGLPVFKSKTDKQSFKVPQFFDLDLKAQLLWLPKFKDGIKIEPHRAFGSAITRVKSVTISQSASGKYYASLTVEEETDAALNLKQAKILRQRKEFNKIIGLDLGLLYFLITSDEEKISAPKFLIKLAKRLAILQRRLAKKKKGSKNRLRLRKQIAIVHEKIANQRLNFIHQLSRRLVNENQVICLEDLAVANMVKNHKLAKAISDASWGMFRKILIYKQLASGGVIKLIPRFTSTSKPCSTEDCTFVNTNMDLRIRKWTCPACQVTHDRDINAAKVIVRVGKDIPEFKPAEGKTTVKFLKKKANKSAPMTQEFLETERWRVP